MVELLAKSEEEEGGREGDDGLIKICTQVEGEERDWERGQRAVEAGPCTQVGKSTRESRKGVREGVA